MNFEAGNISHFHSFLTSEQLGCATFQGEAGIGHLSGVCTHLGAGKVCRHPLQVFHGQQHFDPLFHTFPPLHSSQI